MVHSPRLLVVAALLLMPAVAGANTLTVKTVHRGDLIELEGGWKTHLTGVVAPGLDEPLGRTVHDFTKRQIEGRRVAVFTFTTDNTAAGIVRHEDGVPFAVIKYGKGLAVDLNALLLEKGYARVNEKYLPPDLSHYRELEAKAREAHLGLWAAGE